MADDSLILDIIANLHTMLDNTNKMQSALRRMSVTLDKQQSEFVKLGDLLLSPPEDPTIDSNLGLATTTLPNSDSMVSHVVKSDMNGNHLMPLPVTDLIPSLAPSDSVSEITTIVWDANSLKFIVSLGSDWLWRIYFYDPGPIQYGSIQVITSARILNVDPVAIANRFGNSQMMFVCQSTNNDYVLQVFDEMPNNIATVIVTNSQPEYLEYPDSQRREQVHTYAQLKFSRFTGANPDLWDAHSDMYAELYEISETYRFQIICFDPGPSKPTTLHPTQVTLDFGSLILHTIVNSHQFIQIDSITVASMLSLDKSPSLINPTFNDKLGDVNSQIALLKGLIQHNRAEELIRVAIEFSSNMMGLTVCNVTTTYVGSSRTVLGYAHVGGHLDMACSLFTCQYPVTLKLFVLVLENNYVLIKHGCRVVHIINGLGATPVRELMIATEKGEEVVNYQWKPPWGYFSYDFDHMPPHQKVKPLTAATITRAQLRFTTSLAPCLVSIAKLYVYKYVLRFTSNNSGEFWQIRGQPVLVSKLVCAWETHLVAVLANQIMVRMLDQYLHFNSGPESVLTTNATVGMEACIMNGTLRTGGAFSSNVQLWLLGVAFTIKPLPEPPPSQSHNNCLYTLRTCASATLRAFHYPLDPNQIIMSIQSAMLLTGSLHLHQLQRNQWPLNYYDKGLNDILATDLKLAQINQPTTIIILEVEEKIFWDPFLLHRTFELNELFILFMHFIWVATWLEIACELLVLQCETTLLSQAIIFKLHDYGVQSLVLKDPFICDYNFWNQTQELYTFTVSWALTSHGAAYINPLIATVLLHLFVKCGQRNNAYANFNKTSQRDVVSCTSWINGLETTILLFRDMRLQSVLQSEATLKCVLPVHAITTDLQKVTNFRGDLIWSGCLSESDLAMALFDIYSTYEDLNQAYKTFIEVELKEKVTILWSVKIILVAVMRGLGYLLGSTGLSISIGTSCATGCSLVMDFHCGVYLIVWLTTSNTRQLSTFQHTWCVSVVCVATMFTLSTTVNLQSLIAMLVWIFVFALKPPPAPPPYSPHTCTLDDDTNCLIPPNPFECRFHLEDKVNFKGGSNVMKIYQRPMGSPSQVKEIGPTENECDIRC